MAVVSVVGTVLISMGIQYLFNLVMGIQPNMSVNYLSELPMQFVYQSAVLILFGCFFFLLTIAVRSTLVSIVALFVYMLLIPNLGGFDLKNLMLLTVPKIYNTSASTMDVISGENTNLMLGYLVVFVVFAVLVFVVYKWDKERLCPRL
ncbi:hypothetical protein [Listeria cornellensis]|uniref:Putative ABC transporter permease n=1 Tax=Listeria cornellensis FSL F6-0969 TaxID=1265820 RepID=W7CGY4_9LIST|nr:hypothetical protein [Listeria cornellensis]EUJ32148.1 putative ABC transporter permease [Listeria cornellensis FSL F6-0969]